MNEQGQTGIDVKHLLRHLEMHMPDTDRIIDDLKLIPDELSYLIRLLRAPQPDALVETEKAGYNLSCYAAAINWRPGDNTREWLDELKRQIEDVQAKHAALAAPRPTQPDALAEALQAVRRELVNLQPHIPLSPNGPFVDSHVDRAVSIIEAALAVPHPDPWPLVRELRDACIALLTMLDIGDKPRKLDAALSWKANDAKADAMGRAAVARATEALERPEGVGRG